MSVADDLAALRRSVEELTFLQHLAMASSSMLDPDDLCALVIRETCEVLGVEVCSLYSVEGNDVVLTATNGLNPAGVGQARMPVGTGITGVAALTRSIIAVRDVTVDPRFHWIDGVDQVRFRSMCSVPLISEGTRVVGVLNVQAVAEHDWSADETAMLSAIAAQLAGTLERSDLHRALERQLAETRTLAESRSDLLSAVSHDLRAPLTVVLTYLEALRDELSGSRREVAEQILDEVVRMERMVGTMLTSLAMEAGAFPLRRQPVDLVELVRAACAGLGAAARDRRIMVRLPRQPLVSDVDADTVRRVVENLLTNAIRHAPTASSIYVTLRRTGAAAEIAVRDHGAGVPAGERTVIFERFRRGGHGGTGVGLFIVRTVVEAHGGEVGVEEPRGGGARFRVRLPLVTPAPDGVATPSL